MPPPKDDQNPPATKRRRSKIRQGEQSVQDNCVCSRFSDAELHTHGCDSLDENDCTAEGDNRQPNGLNRLNIVTISSHMRHVELASQSTGLLFTPERNEEICVESSLSAERRPRHVLTTGRVYKTVSCI